MRKQLCFSSNVHNQLLKQSVSVHKLTSKRIINVRTGSVRDACATVVIDYMHRYHKRGKLEITTVAEFDGRAAQSTELRKW